MFKKILIANRGEIAIRVIKACKEMGISSVSVYSDADKNALHRIYADESVYIGKSDPYDSYLNQEKIIEAVKNTGAEAIHPGYGFLSENSDFAKKCEDEKIIFIGPPSHAIKALSNKTKARQIMIKQNVPIIPGMTKASSDIKLMSEEALKIGFPILIKAAAGGGGKGMRVVNSKIELKEAILSASREAKQAFGNGDIYIEKYLIKPRHIEFQILADSFGNIIHLLERECSIQRRHQKIIEETPSSFMSPSLRKKMGEAAVNAAFASKYVNAGTVEFLVDIDEKFYFLEVNTRLQVEHPITEMITGIDIVQKQIEIAYGMKLSITQNQVKSRGHAIECRIYAEDPENNFFPSPNKINYLKEPTGPGVRIDTGIYSGFDIPVDYDPILSKLIVHAENRPQAISRMKQALKDYIILGPKTPIPLLIDILSSKEFSNGKIYTDFINTHFLNWSTNKPNTELATISYIIHEQLKSKKINKTLPKGSIFPTPWETLENWR